MKSFSAQEAIDFILAHQLISTTYVDELGSDLSRFQSGEDVVAELVRRGRMTTYQQTQLLTGQGEKLCFGPYRLVKPLGEGGMGEVFKAWQPRLGRFVALKFIHAEYRGGQSNALIRFQRESHAIAQLRHANIVVLYDAGEIDGVPFIAMEFVDGMSLSEVVGRSGPLGVKQACEYMRQAALGLQHAFERGFVHRDIKPSNLVVSQRKTKVRLPAPTKPSLITRHDLKRLSDDNGFWSQDRVKILDMGVARLNDTMAGEQGMLTPLTVAGAVLGTPDYLAPEQARDSSKVDIRADLYSLGCTFYFILSGQTPFPGGTPLEKMIRHQCDEAPPLRTLRRDIPVSVARMVDRLLAKRPDDRFQTPLELADALGKYLAGQCPEPELPDPALGPPLSTESTLIVPEEAAEWTSAADSTELGRSTNDESFIILPPGSIPDIWETIIPVDPAPASVPDLRDLDWESVGEFHAKRARKSKLEPVAKVDGHVGAVSGVAVSRDGRLAATADVNGQIRIWDLNDSNPREIRRRHRTAEIQAVVLCADEPKYAVFGQLHQGRTDLVRWDWQSDSLVDWGDFTPLGQKGIGCLSFTPDGEMLAAGGGSLALTWRIENGTATNRKIHKGMDNPIRAIAVSPDRRMLAAAGEERALHFWHMGIGKWVRTGVRVKSQMRIVNSLRYSPDGSMLAMAGLSKRIVLWPIAGESDDTARVLRGHAANVQHIQFIGDGTHLASVGTDGQVLFWNLHNESIVREFVLDLPLAYRVEMSADGTRLVAGFINGTVAIYSLPAPV